MIAIWKDVDVDVVDENENENDREKKKGKKKGTEDEDGIECFARKKVSYLDLIYFWLKYFNWSPPLYSSSTQETRKEKRKKKKEKRKKRKEKREKRKEHEVKRVREQRAESSQYWRDIFFAGIHREPYANTKPLVNLLIEWVS